MAYYKKLLTKILLGKSDSDVTFNDLCHLLEAIGFKQRIRGDHHIFTRNDVTEIINLQPKGSKAKSYQVKQVRNLLVRYNLSLEDNHDQ
jgi:predicted RNA binding protein YcfA (HicA-like mRNA interferase family)